MSLPTFPSDHALAIADGSCPARYTAVFEDQHTRAAVLKGGSNYIPFSSLMGARYDADCVSNMRAFSVARARLLRPLLQDLIGAGSSPLSSSIASSSYYFPNTNRVDTHGKYTLMGERWERAGTVGFRCVADAE